MPYIPTPHLLVEHDGPVAIVTLNNPDMLNAFLDDMHVAMREVWDHLAEDTSVRAAVLTGAGRAFSAGGDIPGFIRNVEDPDYRRASLRGAGRLLSAMVEFPKPLVAAVNGPAVGLGCTVAVLCDLVVIAESTYMADTHVSVGLVCGDGGAIVWPACMSILKAKEFLLLGDRIPARDAVAIGLANRAVPDADVMKEALALANRLADQPPKAVQDTKRAINIHLQQAITAIAPFALAAETESFTTPELFELTERFKSRG